MPDNTYRVSVSAINNSGVMVGTAQLVSSGPGNQSFIYDSAQNQYQFIKIPGSTGAVFAGDINNRGVIVGEYCPDEFCLGGGQSFIDDHGHIQLFNVPGATTTYLSAINDFGSFGGTYQDASGRYFGFVNIDGQITTISQSGYTQVLDINNLGEILVGDTVSNPTGEDTRNYSIWWNAAETPEPTTLALMGLGFMAAGLTAIRRRR
jgi:hypothetical protein